MSCGPDTYGRQGSNLNIHSAASEVVVSQAPLVKPLSKVAPREYAQQAAALLAYTYAKSGQNGKATEILKDLQRSSKTRYVSPYLVAIIYTGLGQKERALAQLERAFQERAAWMVFLKVDPFLDQLHNEPQFSDLLQRIGLLA